MRLNPEREALIRKTAQAMAALGQHSGGLGELLIELDAVRAELADVRKHFEEHLRGPVLSVTLEGTLEALLLAQLRMHAGFKRLVDHLRSWHRDAAASTGPVIDPKGHAADYHGASQLLLRLLNGGP